MCIYGRLWIYRGLSENASIFRHRGGKAVFKKLASCTGLLFRWMEKQEFGSTLWENRAAELEYLLRELDNSNRVGTGPVFVRTGGAVVGSEAAVERLHSIAAGIQLLPGKMGLTGKKAGYRRRGH
ncbi:hypothetical protein C6I21_15470 [Alkalicoccus urumqiensis]|uniref:Uncharacterized protein n=1 Tax=Alkalicoccus urumqiensis TaxID=1548213 RepID=A0A2P6MDA3_ALKUR|nr:hypothetical protein C6I21_15470 [Alkalicoccus urumqiensis]